MQLRVKLLAGFIVMLTLMAILAVTNWWGMENMTEEAGLSTEMESTLSSMIQAEVRQYQYMLTRAEASQRLTRTNIESALKTAQALDARLDSAEQRTRNRDVIAFLEDYSKKFEALVEARVKYDAQQARLVGISAVLNKNFSSLLEGLRSVYLSSGSFDAFNAFDTISRAVRAYDDVRIRAWAFNGQPTRENADKVVEGLRTARALAVDSQQFMRVERNTTLLQNMIQDMDTYLQNFEVLATSSFTVTNLDVEMQQGVEKNLAALRELIGLAAKSFETGKNTTNMVAFLLAGLSILTGVGITWLLSSNVQRQLGKDPGELAVIAQRVAEGDFDIADGSARQGVYGHIVAMVEAMRGHIDSARRESDRAREESERARAAVQTAETASREAEAKTARLVETARQLEDVANVVTAASARLAAQIEQSEQGASVQASRMTETAAAMTQMNATVLEVARNAGSASDVSAATRQKAQSGAGVSRQAVESIRKVQQQAVSLRTDMAQLDESAQSISTIMGVISDIADQTNLLALNAAIEAARAGEAGRGFAVVADEVRKLAEKTMVSTQDVGQAIAAIQQAAVRNVHQVDASVQAVEEATGLVNQSGEALGEITAMVDSTADQVRAIAAASEEQSATSDEINRSVGEVEVIAGETARAMQEANAAVADLSAQAQILGRLIEDLKRG